MIGRSSLRALVLALALLASPMIASNAYAACSSPSGNAGDINFSSSQALMVYCNGTSWISMGSNAGTSFGTLTTGNFCTATSSSSVSCTTAAINLATQVTGSLPVGDLPNLLSTDIWVGNSSGVATSVALSGDCTLSNTGVLTCTKTGGTAFGALATMVPTGTASASTYLRGDGSWAASGAGTLPSLGSGNIWVGNASAAATAVPLTGDCGISNAGAISCTKTSGAAFGALATLAPTGTPSSSTYLRGDGTWAAVSSGTTTGAGVANYVALWNGTTSLGTSAIYQSGSSIGIGTTVASNTLTLNGTLDFLFGTNYATAGTQSDVAINTAASIRYTGTAVATFNGIVAGANGQIMTLHNGSTSILTLANQSATDTTVANQIVTGTGANLTVAPNSAVILQYDNAATNSSGSTGAWRVIGGSGGGGLTGGVANTVPLWTGTTAIGTSVLSQSGTNIGIGSTAPVGILDMTQTLTPSTAGTYTGINFNNSLTDSYSGTTLSNFYGLNINPTLSFASYARAYGILVGGTIATSATGTPAPNTFTGIVTNQILTAVGTRSSNLVGITSSPSFTATSGTISMQGISTSPSNSSSGGTVTTLYGVNAAPLNSGTVSGTVVGVYTTPINTGTTLVGIFGVYASPQHGATGTLPNMYGVYSQCQNWGGGTVSNCYGLYLDTPNNSGTITNKYGIWQNDSASTNYFAGNVGIATGTATLSNALTVNGTASATVMNVAPQAVAITAGGAGSATVNTATAGQMAYYSTSSALSGTSDLYVSGSSIGIGTTTPVNTVDVGAGALGALTGNVVSVSNTANNSVFAFGQGATNRARLAWIYNATAASAYTVLGDAYGTHPLILQDAGGNVGIGTNAPQTLLDVNGSSTLRGEIEFYSGAVKSRMGISSYTGDSTVLGIGNDASSTVNKIAFVNNGGERMRIDTTGNVGIGTTGPLQTLSLYKAGENDIGFTNSNTPATYGVLVGLTSLAGQILSTAAVGDFIINNRQGNIKLSADSANTRSDLTVLASNGNVGIGTTGPLATLDVAPSGGGAVYFRDSAGTAGTIRMVQSAGTNYIQSGVSTVTSSAAPLYFTDMNGSHTWMVIGSTGNVGIGNTNPIFPLDISGGTSVTASSYGCTSGYGALYASGANGPNSCSNTITVSLRTANRILAPEVDATSDARLKNVRAVLSGRDALATVGQLNPVFFNWKPEAKMGDTSLKIGFLAQEVAPLIPTAVTQAPGVLKDQYYLNYEAVIPYLAGAVKEMKALFDTDHDRVAKLESENADQAAAIKQLRDEFEAYKKVHP